MIIKQNVVPFICPQKAKTIINENNIYNVFESIHTTQLILSNQLEKVQVGLLIQLQITVVAAISNKLRIRPSKKRFD